jgi:hypothetical protein
MNEYKMEDANNASHPSRNKIRFARFVTSNATFTVLFFALLIEQCIICGPFFYLYGTIPNPPTYFAYIGFGSGVIHAVLFFLGILAVFILDIRFHMKKHGCGIVGYFNKDPLNYRTDFVYIVLLIVFCLIYVAFNLAPYTYATAVLEAISFFMFKYCLLLAVGWSCVLVVFKRLVQGYYTRKSVDDYKLSQVQLLELALNNPEEMEAFTSYCNNELSTENIKAYSDLKSYLELKDKATQVEMSRNIFSKYIEPNGVMQVTLSSGTQQRLVRAFEELESQVLETIFDEFRLEVRSNLLDSFGRFQSTEVYRKLRRRASFDMSVVATNAVEVHS